VRQFTPIVVGFALVSVLVTARAEAAAQDAEAQELADQAIFTDYLQLDFKAGEKKLQQAIALCEKGSCSRTVHAQVYRDLAVIYITGMKRSDEGRKLLVKALRLDPRIALDADLTTPDLIRVFEEAQKEAAEPDESSAPEPAPAPAPKRSEPKAAAQAEAKAPKPEAEESAPAGSMDEAGSADCPPDFPGCEAIPEETPKEEEEGPDLGIVNWLSAGLQQDFLMFSGETGVCGAEGPEELSCFRSGDEFRDPTLVGTAGTGGEVGGGFRPATTRLLIGYDRVLFLPNLSIGARLGYAIGGGPAEPNGAAFVPFHAEVRGTYWFAPIQVGKIRPYAALGGGLAQIDSSVTTEVVDRGPQGQIPLDDQGQPRASRVTVWKKTGTTFASLGGGAMYPLGDKDGITAELKAVLLFPSSGLSVGLQAGYTHGF
jgi:hypothetical protein